MNISSRHSEANWQRTIEEEIAKISPFLRTRDREFLKRVYATPASVYQNRLTQIGAINRKRILDAGCGFGQWSLAMAETNNKVVAFDAMPDRVIFLDRLREKLNLSQLAVHRSTLGSTPFEQGSFDFVFCYGTIFLTDWQKSLAELSRITEPGGRVYVNLNGIGWYVFLWQSGHNRSEDYDPRLYAAQSLLNTCAYNQSGTPPEKADVVIDKEGLLSAANQLSLQLIDSGGDGDIGADVRPSPTRFFQSEYYGLTGSQEYLFEKC